MAEEKKKKGEVVCQCNMGACACGHQYYGVLRIVRAVFIVIVLVIVFMLGVTIGQLRGMLESRYSYHMMGMESYGSYPMMKGGMNGTMLSTTPTSSAQ